MTGPPGDLTPLPRLSPADAIRRIERTGDGSAFRQNQRQNQKGRSQDNAADHQEDVVEVSKDYLATSHVSEEEVSQEQTPAPVVREVVSMDRHLDIKA